MRTSHSLAQALSRVLGKPRTTVAANKGQRRVARTALAAAPLVLSAAVPAAAVVGAAEDVEAQADLLQVTAWATAAGVHLWAAMVLYTKHRGAPLHYWPW